MPVASIAVVRSDRRRPRLKVILIVVELRVIGPLPVILALERLAHARNLLQVRPPALLDFA